MRKRGFKKGIACFLVLTMVVASLTGCGSSETSEEKNTTDTSAKVETTTDNSSSSDTAADGSKPFGNGETLTIWVNIDSTSANNMADYSNTLASAELEEKTGVHIEFKHPSTSGQQEEFNLLIASDNLPDIMWYNSNNARYTGGLDALIDDGVMVDLTESLLDNYMPNYKAAINRNETTKRQVYTDTSRMPLVWMLNIEPEWDWGGPMIRKDWLADCGLEVPVTYDDWTVMLRAFKEKYGATAPLLTGSKTVFTMLESLTSGYGVTDNYHNEDGKAIYGPIQDNYKDMLKMLHSWYDEGLIDTEFYTRDTTDNTTLANNQTGAIQFGIWTYITNYETNYGIEMTPAPYPVLNKGDVSHLGWQQYEICSDAMGITTQCANTELAAKWLDYLYSNEGYILKNYGVENETYIVEDGEMHLTEDVREKLASGNYTRYDWFGTALAGIYDWKNNLFGNDERNLNCYTVWDASTDGAWTMPPSTMTSEEGAQYSVLIGDISTYVDENTVKFITGSKDIDTEWDAYVADIKASGIDEATALQQAALDRYFAR